MPDYARLGTGRRGTKARGISPAVYAALDEDGPFRILLPYIAYGRQGWI